MGSMFTTYKSPALVNLDYSVTFTPELLLKDLDLGLAAARANGVPMPVTTAAREVVQTLIGNGYTEEDFAALLSMQRMVFVKADAGDGTEVTLVDDDDWRLAREQLAALEHLKLRLSPDRRLRPGRRAWKLQPHRVA